MEEGKNAEREVDVYKVPYERVVQILQDYVGNDAEAAEPAYVADVLFGSVCSMTKEEAEALGLGYLYDAYGEEEEDE